MSYRTQPSPPVPGTVPTVTSTARPLADIPAMLVTPQPGTHVTADQIATLNAVVVTAAPRPERAWGVPCSPPCLPPWAVPQKTY